MPEFNQGQLSAIHHVNGPMLALAGPGSGKTTTMVHRIQYLIEQAKVPAARILVITFTRASAREMEERFYHLMGGSGYKCTFGTFHSVFFSILKMAYGYRSQDIRTFLFICRWRRDISGYLQGIRIKSDKDGQA